MRIVGEIDHLFIKITIFKMDDKFSVKFETGQIEQIYKFGERENINSVDEIRNLIDDTFLQNIEYQFKMMQQNKIESLNRIQKLENFEFPKIV